MIDIENYLNDGANWQAQAILAYLRNKKEHILEDSYVRGEGYFRVDLRVGRYENCREQGYVFSLYWSGNQRNYAVYEHRNSDQLIVLISNVCTIDTPSVNIMWHDKGENATKYDYDKSFGYGEIMKCGDWIIEDMKKTIRDWGFSLAH